MALHGRMNAAKVTKRKRKIVRTNAHKALGKKKNRHNPGPSYK